MFKVLLVFGTRPEAIKVAPLYWEFKKHSNFFDVKLCVTAQHRQMLDQVVSFFEIKPDYDLNLMKENQTLFDITANSLMGLEKVYNDFKPDLIFVQGDTTTAFVGALAAFYKKIKIAHIEAGLRSYNKYSPYPEEINRVLVGHLVDYHFAPTKLAKKNLKKENINSNIYVVGNTVIDALFLALKKIEKNKTLKEEIVSFFVDRIHYKKGDRVILVTGHRRESFGKGFENICLALKKIAQEFRDTKIVYPVHLNPNVKEPVYRILKGIKNLYLLDPLEYPYLVWLLSQCYLVLTDSGGIQEEAPSLGKPVLVMREVTERTEGIDAGTAKLVGTDIEKIVTSVSLLLKDLDRYNEMAKAINPYGDGKSSQRILKQVKKIFNL